MFTNKIYTLCLCQKGQEVILDLKKKKLLPNKSNFSADIDHPSEPRVTMTQPLNKEIDCDYEICGCRSNSLIWVSKRLNLLYFENPKCGSSSIKSFFDIKQPDKYDIVNEIIFLIKSGKTENAYIYSKSKSELRDLIKYANHLLDHLGNIFLNDTSCYMLPHPSPSRTDEDFQMFYGPKDIALELYKGFTSFSFVRNPWDKMVSNWAMFTQKRDRIKIIERMFGAKNIDKNFPEFLNLTLLKKNHHWESQMKFFPSDFKRIDLIGKLENFDKDFGALARNCGCEYRNTTVNKTERESYKRYYDEKSIKIVKNIYKDEIENFDYRF